MKIANLVVCAVLLASASCAGGNESDIAPLWEDGPGNQAWDSDDVSCSSDGDCGPGEACGSGVCQMKVCAEPAYESVAPMGKIHYFVKDQEFAIVGDDHYVDTYEPKDASYQGSIDYANQAKIVDVAGGDFLGRRPQAYAYAREGTKDVIIAGSGDKKTITLSSVTPTRLAAGDVDADGLDELVVLGAGGGIAVCDVDTGKCAEGSFDGVEGLDVTVADVDNDGFAEPVFLVKKGNDREIIVWNVDHEKTAQEETIAWTFGDSDFKSIAGGDLDGDGNAEIVILHESGWWDQKNDQLHVFSPKDEKIIGSTEVHGHSIDVTVGESNGNGNADVGLLRSDRHFELRRQGNPGHLDLIYEHTLDVGDGASRITMLDVDGDSATGKLEGGPELVPGTVVPTTLLIFPPFYKTWQENSATGIGQTDNISETTTEAVSLSVGMSIGISANVGVSDPVTGIGAKVSASVTASISHDLAVSHAFTKSVSIGKKWSIDAKPEYGREYAGIVIGSGCYHAYKYAIDDPANKVGGAGIDILMLVPLGGETQLWSTKRYNAMAKALGTLPEIEVPYTIGSVPTYPTSPQLLDGSPIPSEDLLFTEPPQMQVSDIADVGWSLTVGEAETNAVTETTTIGVSNSVGGGFSTPFGGADVTFTTNVSTSWSQGYSVTVGKDATFWGTVKPLRDNPDTPEDEFNVHRYTFSPLVFRQHYKGPAGEDAGYYVVSYSVSGEPPPDSGP